MSSKVVFVLGAGGRIGAALRSKFAENGYKVALASRSAKTNLESDGTLNVRLDLANPAEIEPAFKAVKDHFGSGPSVVVYNAAAAEINPDPLALSADIFPRLMNINVISAFVAAQKLVKGRVTDDRVTFMYTGNITNTSGALLPSFMSSSIGKAGAANMLESLGAAYADKNAFFYYCDERTSEGKPAFAKVDGPAHADFYFSLAERSSTENVPTLQTFVKGHGYVRF